MSIKDRIDPELADTVNGILGMIGPDFMGTKTAAFRRGKAAEFMSAMPVPSSVFPEVAREQHLVPRPDAGVEVPLTLFRPPNAPNPSAAIVHYHGGGFTIGSPKDDDALLARLASELNLLVLSVDYRLAPETIHPGPIEDCYAALKWAADSADELGIDTDRIAVYGHSAGGGLAANVALMARDRGGPKIAFQMLCYPMLDDRMETPSITELDGIGVWGVMANRKGWEALILGTEEGRSTAAIDVLPYAAAARAASLEGLPPAYIDTAELEILLDENIDYARRLIAGGVATELRIYPRTIHGFDGFCPTAEVSKRAVAARFEAFRRALRPD